jgi:hypothetical protein
MRRLALIVASVLWATAALAFTPLASGGGAGGGTVPFSLPTGDVVHYMSPTGSDSNDGLTTGTAWATPNHVLNCGDVIIAASGAYSSGGIDVTTQPSNCPSTTGGIDGVGGIWFAVVLCNGNVGVCTIDKTGPTGFAWNVQASNWAIEGWLAGTTVNNDAPAGFAMNGANGTTHHVAFINDIASSVGTGFEGLDNGVDHDVPGATGFDYYAVVGSIAQNAEQWNGCTAQIVGAGPATVTSITYSGTHQFFYGNFSYATGNNRCGSDVESYMFDTWDAHAYISQSVMLNNIGWSSYRMGIQVFMQNFNSVTGLKYYILNNTEFNANAANGAFGEINIQQSNATSPSITMNSNIALGTRSTSCALSIGGDRTHVPAWYANIIAGGTGLQNVLFSTGGGSPTCYYNSYTGPSNINFAVNPSFTNTTDLLASQSGAPNCSSFVNTTACMGWNANTATLTTPSVISDLVPTCGADCAGAGYQEPRVSCASTGNISGYYPTWLKGVVYLHWNGSSLTRNADLVTLPCGL